MVEMKVQGIFFDSETNQSIVVLKEESSGRTLPIWVGLFEANAITMGIEHTWTPRPMTHDLIKNLIEGMKAKVRRITVNDLRSNTFYAVISLEVDGRKVDIDSRPSDAIALALRTRAPIFVEDTVIDNAKTVDFVPEAADTDRLQKWLESLDPEDLGKYKM